jgi:hypothetical protein
MGSELVRIIGRDMTGRWFDPGTTGSDARRSFDTLVAVAGADGIAYRRGFPIFSASDKDHLYSERILLPLARDGTTPDILLALSLHHSVSAALALQHAG